MIRIIRLFISLIGKACHKRTVTSAERRRRNALLICRPPLTEREIYEIYRTDSTLSLEQFAYAWRKIAAILHADAGRLRPGDELALLSGVASGDELAQLTDVEDLVFESEVRQCSMPQAKCSDIRSLGDIIEALADDC
ncbi:MAG: hypothetical protein P4L33_07385 [Capsulimonadaceae bacterium]|nr:hypothetical protein [Capsulimonadaceae bacterium]